MRIHGLLCLLALSGVGCDSTTEPTLAEPTLRDGEPFIVGPVIARDGPIAESDDRYRLHVKEHEDEECGVIFGVGPDTEIARATGEGTTEPAHVADLHRGLTVAVWFTGWTFDTCPAQAGAEAVEILSS